MKRVRSMILLLLCVVPGISLNADVACDPTAPAFTVNQVEQWKGRSAADIFNSTEKVKEEDAGSSSREKILLLDLLREHGNSGTIILKNCTGNALTIRLADLYNPERTVSGYYLMLTKKDTFKLLKFRDDDKKDMTLLRHLGKIALVKSP